jgi:hypothetical protein
MTNLSSEPKMPEFRTLRIVSGCSVFLFAISYLAIASY